MIMLKWCTNKKSNSDFLHAKIKTSEFDVLLLLLWCHYVLFRELHHFHHQNHYHNAIVLKFLNFMKRNIIFLLNKCQIHIEACFWLMNCDTANWIFTYKQIYQMFVLALLLHCYFKKRNHFRAKKKYQLYKQNY